ncbi:c2H2-type domain-containing protein [Trichonephila inaurata madagascariensis]|uniref:C2H2-type domain-containing protein n=1 Tax=Trichonephila inaurata madagascariensis TaxID=2747483 RepID=A0A8X6XL98_9ARAC|nr:c2H2-type domain-containing protein [Trichonephila inaurata madagascariensis]
MYRSYYYVEIFILLLLYYAGWNLPSKSVFKCSRIKSRLVRMIIYKKVLPILHRYRLSLPRTCPFHSERDILWWPDIQIDFQDGQWVCPFCGQAFANEELVMKHWDKKHLNNHAEETVCFANFCDIFRCEVILAAVEAEKNKFAWDKFPSFPYSQNRSNCDDKKMIKLQKKCKVLIGQCLLDFLQPLSSKDFQDIEDEVNQAICSYLTCNKYTDGSLQVVEPVPVLVCVIVGSVLIGGFCLCYYVVYTLSYPEHSINNESFCNGAIQVRSLRNTKYHNNYIHHQNKKEIHRTHR